jgi:hypothetical protein
MAFPSYGTTTGASFTPFAQAADFYNSVGINVHPAYPGLASDAEMQLAIDRIQELGIRYARGLGLWSPAFKADGFIGQIKQYWLINCMQATSARNRSSGGPDGTGEHPTFNSIGLDAEREYYTGNPWFDSRASYELFDNDGGESFFRPMDGPAGVVGETAVNYAGAFYSFNKSTSGPPIGWGGVETLNGPNEPETRGVPHFGDLPSERGIRWAARSMKRLRDDPARAHTMILNGEDYISYATGRITSGPATMAQLPVLPFNHFTGGGWQQAGDYTDRSGGEFASFHVYWNGTPPNWDYYWANPSQQATGYYGWMHGADAVNGHLAPGGQIWSRTLPLLMTEMGHVQFLPQAPAIACPPEVAGEFLIQQLVMNYLQGVKRSYIYKLSHEGGDQGAGIPAMGLCSTDLTRLPSFHAIKNLMALVGWRQGPDEGVQPIQIPHTFTPGANQFGDDLDGGNEFRDMCMKLVLRRSADEFLILLVRPRLLWSRNTFRNTFNGSNEAAATAASRRTVADPRDTVLTLPAGTWIASIAEPAKNPILSPVDGQSYANPNNGTAFAAPGVSGNGFTQSGNQLTVRMAGITRVVRIIRTG